MLGGIGGQLMQYHGEGLHPVSCNNPHTRARCANRPSRSSHQVAPPRSHVFGF